MQEHKLMVTNGNHGNTYEHHHNSTVIFTD